MANSARESAIAPGMRAIRDHLLPILLIQACVLATVFAYYRIPGFAVQAEKLQHLKVDGGFAFAFIATGFAGGILPELFKWITRDPQRHPLPEVLYTFGVFGLNGIIVDLFYQAQGLIFGNDASFGVVAAKVVVDQTIGSIVIFCPYFLTLILLYKCGFSLARFREALREQPFFSRMWPVVVVNWAYWIPALFGVYAMPANLQFMLFLFVEAAWSLILINVAKQNRQPWTQEIHQTE